MSYHRCPKSADSNPRESPLVRVLARSRPHRLTTSTTTGLVLVILGGLFYFVGVPVFPSMPSGTIQSEATAKCGGCRGECCVVTGDGACWAASDCAAMLP